MKSSSTIVTLKKLLGFSEVNHSRQSLLFKNLLVCLDTLHGTGIYHGCINLDNIWIEDMFYVSLGPFCLPLDASTGHLMFKPPEQVLAEKPISKEALFKADIWAVGLVFCVLRYGLYFADQLQMVASEDSYLEFCELTFDFDSQGDYSYTSYQHLQKIKRRRGQNTQKDADFDISFLKSCKEDIRRLVLLQGLLNCEPQSRLTSKELLCVNLFRDCQGLQFSASKEKRPPTIETGNNRRHTPPVDQTKQSRKHNHEGSAGIEYRPRSKNEAREDQPRRLDGGNPRHNDTSTGMTSTKKDEEPSISWPREPLNPRDMKFGPPLTPQTRPRQEPSHQQATAASDSLLRSADIKNEADGDGRPGYRALRDRREAMRREISAKRDIDDDGLQEKSATVKEREQEFRHNGRRDHDEMSHGLDDVQPRLGPRKRDNREEGSRLQFAQVEQANTVPSDHLTSKFKHYDFELDDDNDEKDKDLQASGTINKHSYGYMGIPKEDKARQQLTRQTNHRKDSDHSKKDALNFIEENLNKLSEEEFQPEEKSLAKVSKPFFKSSNSNILQDSVSFIKNVARREMPQESGMKETSQYKFSQTAPALDRRVTPTRRNFEGSVTGEHSETTSSPYVPKFDVQRRSGYQNSMTSNGFDSKRIGSIEGSVTALDSRQEDFEGTGPIKYFKESQGHFKPKAAPRNLTAIIKLSTVKFMDDTLDGYNFISGSLVYKKSILDERGVTLETEIKEAAQELSLNSVFTVSLPATKPETAEELRVDLTLYGHKEKSNFKRYLSSGSLDIRSAVMSQLLGPHQQRALENKWCLLRNTQRLVNGVVLVEVVVEELVGSSVNVHREDSLERNRSNQTTGMKRRRETPSNLSPDDEEIQIKEETSEINSSPIRRNRSRVNDSGENQRNNLRYSSNQFSEGVINHHNHERIHQKEAINQAIKPNFSFGKIAGKPVQDQKEALKREIEDLRNSIDKADNLQAYPKALGLLRELINKGNSTNHFNEPN